MIGCSLSDNSIQRNNSIISFMTVDLFRICSNKRYPICLKMRKGGKVISVMLIKLEGVCEVIFVMLIKFRTTLKSCGHYW